MANAKRDENRITTLIGVSSVDVTTPTLVAVNPVTNAIITEGTTIVNNSLIIKAFDYIAATYPTTSSEVYTYKTGGSGGTTVGTITVVYSDAVTKAIITSVTKS
jgi:hypothetical protein